MCGVWFNIICLHIEMKFNKVHIGHRILWLMMAVHILNFSIDNPHTLFEHNKVDADFDEIDSVVELVVEDVLNIDDAIPEHHSKTPMSHKFMAKKMIWLFEEQMALVFSEPTTINFRIVQSNIHYANPIYNSPLVNIFSPPPQV